LVDLYKDRGIVIGIDGSGEVDEITERILNSLEQ
jgi:adenylate kinase family enzyme